MRVNSPIRLIDLALMHDLEGIELTVGIGRVRSESPQRHQFPAARSKTAISRGKVPIHPELRGGIGERWEMEPSSFT